jgi:hypothetical protein
LAYALNKNLDILLFILTLSILCRINECNFFETERKKFSIQDCQRKVRHEGIVYTRKEKLITHYSLLKYSIRKDITRKGINSKFINRIGINRKGINEGENIALIIKSHQYSTYEHPI